MANPHYTPKFEGKITTRMRPYLSISHKSALKLVYLDDIYYIKAFEKALVIRTRENRYPRRGTLNALEAVLPDYFLRVHRNALISPLYMDSLEGTGVERRICFKDIEDTIRVSRRNIPLIRRRIRNGAI